MQNLSPIEINEICEELGETCPKIKLTPVLIYELSNDSLKDCIDFLRCHRPCGC